MQLQAEGLLPHGTLHPGQFTYSLIHSFNKYKCCLDAGHYADKRYRMYSGRIHSQKGGTRKEYTLPPGMTKKEVEIRKDTVPSCPLEHFENISHFSVKGHFSCPEEHVMALFQEGGTNLFNITFKMFRQAWNCILTLLLTSYLNICKRTFIYFPNIFECLLMWQALYKALKT